MANTKVQLTVFSLNLWRNDSRIGEAKSAYAQVKFGHVCHLQLMHFEAH